MTPLIGTTLGWGDFEHRQKLAYLEAMGREELPAPPPPEFAGQWLYGQRRGGVKAGPEAAHYLAMGTGPTPTKFNPLPKKKKAPAKPVKRLRPVPVEAVSVNLPHLRIIAA